MKEPLRMLGAVTKKEESLKTPRLTIIRRSLVAVDECGNRIATLLLLDTSCGDPVSPVRHRLTERGYRTDWAEWTDAGDFVRLLEDVES